MAHMKSSVGCGDDAVEEDLGIGQVGGRRSDVDGTVNQISADGEGHTILVLPFVGELLRRFVRT